MQLLDRQVCTERLIWESQQAQKQYNHSAFVITRPTTYTVSMLLSAPTSTEKWVIRTCRSNMPLNHNRGVTEAHLNAQQWTLQMVAREYSRITVDELYCSVDCRHDSAGIQRCRRIAHNHREVDCPAFTSDSAPSSTCWQIGDERN